MQLAADGVQHFAVGLHSLGQVLHDLHIQIPPDVGVLFSKLQVADAGGHLANILHGLQDVLLHSHYGYLQSLGEKCFLISRRYGSASRRSQPCS